MYKLLRLEWFKLRRRLTTWAIYTIFLALTALPLGTRFYVARRHGGPSWGLPDAWPDILGAGASITSIFAAVLVALTVASEFEWRTSRQNIIDGLSRNQWFLAKVLLIPTICLVFYGTQILLGTLLALMDTHSAHRHPDLSALTYVAAGLGVWLGLCLYSAIALFISMWLRSSGLAIALTIIYQVFDTIAARTLRGFQHDGIARWLPMQVNSALLQFNQYLPQRPPTLEYQWSTWGLVVAGLGWVGVFAVASYLLYSKRDL